MTSIIKRASVAHYHTLNWTLGAPSIVIEAQGASGSTLSATLDHQAADNFKRIEGAIGAGQTLWTLTPAPGPTLAVIGGGSLDLSTSKAFAFRLFGVGASATQAGVHTPVYVTVRQGGVLKQGTIYTNTPPISLGVDVIEIDMTPPNQWVDLYLRVL